MSAEVAAVTLCAEGFSLVRAAEIDTEVARLKDRIAALAVERQEIVDMLMGPDGYEERTPWATYRLVPRTRKTARAIDTERFIDLFPHLALDYGTLRISVAKAEKGLSAEDFAKVVIPGGTVDAEPELRIEPHAGAVEVTER